MAHHDGFVRTDSSPALINNDTGGLEQYRMNRLKAKSRKSLEQRVLELENRLANIEILLKERD